MFSARGQDSGFEDDHNELHSACERGTLDEIIKCLQSSGSEIQWYHDGQTPMHVAVVSGRPDATDVLTVLLDHDADVNAQTITDGNTPLHMAVLHGDFPRDFETVMFFLENNADLKIRNKALRTPYDCAVASGQFELAGTIDGSMPPERARAFYREMIGQRYGPYIIEAVLDSDERKIKENIALGGDPNFLNMHGAGAIHYAVTHCNIPVYDTLSLLLHAGADPNLRDDEGDTAVNLVIKNQNLRDNGQMERCVQLLVDARAESNICDCDGKDACKLAEEKGYDDILMILMKKPAKPSLNKKDSKKSVVINESRKPSLNRKESQKLVVIPELPPSRPLLLSETLPPSPIPPPSKSPPPATSTSPQPASVEMVPSGQQQEPVHPTEGDEPVMPSPRTPREDPNAPNAEGLCPIHVATLLDNETLRHSKINTLIDKGAEVNKQIEASGNTALHLCAERNYGITAGLLLSHHIDYTIKNKNGKTAYDIAQELGHNSVLEAIDEKRKEVQDNWKKGAKKAKFCTIL